ncbi:hypothetical protein LWI28_011899 [Acer negundo]|uniref:Uncharacterized protein n=1 Tax=Acer negundo TaxID=4023 RepID=A0AAD5NND8_ACENE|nr:hypothetical protein LWI28_011899 [Acer negundo]
MPHLVSHIINDSSKSEISCPPINLALLLTTFRKFKSITFWGTYQNRTLPDIHGHVHPWCSTPVNLRDIPNKRIPRFTIFGRHVKHLPSTLWEPSIASITKSSVTHLEPYAHTQQFRAADPPSNAARRTPSDDFDHPNLKRSITRIDGKLSDHRTAAASVSRQRRIFCCVGICTF